MLNDLDLSRIKHVYVKPSRTDLRKGIDGLSAIVRADLKLDPTDGSLFLFCGTRADRIKGLLYEGDGYLLLYKRCSDGRFHWLHNSDEAKALTQEQFDKIRPFKPTMY